MTNKDIFSMSLDKYIEEDAITMKPSNSTTPENNGNFKRTYSTNRAESLTDVTSQNNSNSEQDAIIMKPLNSITDVTSENDSDSFQRGGCYSPHPIHNNFSEISFNRITNEERIGSAYYNKLMNTCNNNSNNRIQRNSRRYTMPYGRAQQRGSSFSNEQMNGRQCGSSNNSRQSSLNSNDQAEIRQIQETSKVENSLSNIKTNAHECQPLHFNTSIMLSSFKEL